jgi:hypothetical protein
MYSFMVVIAALTRYFGDFEKMLMLTARDYVSLCLMSILSHLTTVIQWSAELRQLSSSPPSVII